MTHFLLYNERHFNRKSSSGGTNLFSRLCSSFGLVLLAVFLQLACLVPAAAAPGPAITIDQQAHALVATEGLSYEWYYNAAQLPGANGRELTISKSGNYSVKVKTASGEELLQQVTVAVQPNGTIRKIFLIGDSTVQDYNSGWYPQTGWGQVLPLFFDNSQVTVVNKAVGGTSSRSFYNSFWPAVWNEVQEDDYVFIQFGHNDYNPNDPNRHTTDAEYKQFIQNYVLQTRSKYAYPVLVTPVHRNNWNGDQISNGWRNYPNLMREVAAQLNVPLIDLHNRSEDLFESLGRAYVEKHVFLFLKAGEYPRTPLDVSNLTDGVHFQEMGALDLAKLIVEGIKALPARSEMAALVPHLKPVHQVTVTSNTPQATNITRTASFPAGATVTLKADRPSGFNFSGWTHSDGSLVSLKMNHSFTMPANPVSFQGNFSAVAPTPIVAGATYRIEAKHSQFFLDINNLWREASSPTANGTGIVQYPYTGNLSQQWALSDAGDGYFTITSVSSNKSMDVQSKSTADGANVLQYTTGTAASTNQHFKIEPAGEGYYRLVARHSNKCLQIDGASTDNGALLKQNTCGTSDSQLFAFHRVVVASSPEEKELATELQVYPNPSHSAFQISTSFKFSYLIYDELGKVQEEGAGYRQQEIGGALKPGMYFLKVQHGQKYRFIKLLKQ